MTLAITQYKPSGDSASSGNTASYDVDQFTSEMRHYIHTCFDRFTPNHLSAKQEQQYKELISSYFRFSPTTVSSSNPSDRLLQYDDMTASVFVGMEHDATKIDQWINLNRREIKLLNNPSDIIDSMSSVGMMSHLKKVVLIITAVVVVGGLIKGAAIASILIRLALGLALSRYLHNRVENITRQFHSEIKELNTLIQFVAMSVLEEGYLAYTDGRVSLLGIENIRDRILSRVNGEGNLDGLSYRAHYLSFSIVNEASH